MVLFGIEFSPAEAVLLGIGVLLVLMMVALLRKGAPRAERAAQPQEAPAAKPTTAPQQAEEEELIGDFLSGSAKPAIRWTFGMVACGTGTAGQSIYLRGYLEDNYA